MLIAPRGPARRPRLRARRLGLRARCARARLFRFVFRAVLSLLLLVAGGVLGVLALGVQGMQRADARGDGGAHQGRADRRAALRRDGDLRRRPRADLRRSPATTSTSTATSSSGRRSPTCSACTTSYRLDRISRPLSRARAGEHGAAHGLRDRRAGDDRPGRARPRACRSPTSSMPSTARRRTCRSTGRGELELKVSTTGLLLRPCRRRRRHDPARSRRAAPSAPSTQDSASRQKALNACATGGRRLSRRCTTYQLLHLRKAAHVEDDEALRAQLLRDRVRREEADAEAGHHRLLQRLGARDLERHLDLVELRRRTPRACSARCRSRARGRRTAP